MTTTLTATNSTQVNNRAKSSLTREQLHTLVDRLFNAVELVPETSKLSQVLPQLAIVAETMAEIQNEVKTIANNKLQRAFINEVEDPKHPVKLGEFQCAPGFLVNEYYPYEAHKKLKNGGYKTKVKLPTLDNAGYPTYGKPLGKVHILVHNTFNNDDKPLVKVEDEDKDRVDHINNCRIDFHTDNLRALTAAENANNRKDQASYDVEELAHEWRFHCFHLTHRTVRKRSEDISAMNLYYHTFEDRYFIRVGDLLRELKMGSNNNIQFGFKDPVTKTRRQMNLNVDSLGYDWYDYLDMERDGWY